MFKRDEVIRLLIEDDINSYVEHGHVDTLWFILERGFKGYAHFTDDELIQECNERDISYFVGEFEDD